MKPIVRLLTVPLLAAALTACTSQQLHEAAYNSMQMRQREECNKLPPGADREQCRNDASGESYDQYKRDTDAAKK